MTRRLTSSLWVVWLALCAGCDGGGASGEAELDATVLDAAPEPPPDAQVLTDQGHMGPCAELPRLEAQPDGAWVFEGQTEGAHYASTCGGEAGHDRVLQFTAPEPGRWRIHVTADFDPMLSARADCVLRESERACNDDLEFPRRRDAAIQLDLAADETIYLVVDTYVELGLPNGGAFRLEATRVPVVRPDDACDPLRLADGCATGHVCTPDHPGLIGGPGTCRRDARPTVDAAWVHRDGTDLHLRVDGRDATGDVTSVRLQLYQNRTRVPVGRHGEDTWVLGTEVFGALRFSTVHHGPLLAEAEQADAVELWLVDAQGNDSARTRLPLEPAPQLALGDVCDDDRVLDTCPPGAACRSERCTAVAAPTIESATVFWNREIFAFGVEVIGHDLDADLRGLTVAVYDDAGEPVGDATRPFDRVEWAAGGRFRAVLGFAANPALRFAEAVVVVFDAEGGECAPVQATLAEPIPVERGAECDPSGARTRCGEGLRCVGARPVCEVPQVACPDDFSATEAVPQGDDTWVAPYDLWGRPDRGPASCGGGVGQAYIGFTAPAAGTYEATATAQGAEADPLLSARSHCAYADPAWSERACNDDRGLGDRAASVRLFLGAGEPVWFVVDGYSGADGWWAGPGALTVRRLE